MGVFASIYHPVGIPMLVQSAKNPGFTIGVNGLAGNLGIAVAAILTGFLVKHGGLARRLRGARRCSPSPAACSSPLLAPREETPPAKRPKKSRRSAARVMVRVFA